MAAKYGSGQLWWSIPAVAFVVLAILVVLGGGSQEHVGTSSTYDASPEGVRAAYLLLGELGYPVERSKRPASGTVRWVLFPTHAQRDVDLLHRWLRDGGKLFLADTSGKLAEKMDIALQIDQVSQAGDQQAASGLGITQLHGGSTRVSWPGQAGRVEVSAGGEPFITVYRRGRGELWLANRPDFLRNKFIGKADNGVLVCRLAERMLGPTAGRVDVDEYFHGMRDRPGATELLLQPPTVWVTAQALIVMGLVLWHVVPRFGRIPPASKTTRRSKAEFLEAMAILLDRKGDQGDAFRTMRDDLVREIGHDLGLPPETAPEVVARAAGRRRSFSPERFLQLVRSRALPPRAGRAGLVKAVNDLEAIHREFFDGRNDR
jgi:hypothetical protein